MSTFSSSDCVSDYRSELVKRITQTLASFITVDSKSSSVLIGKILACASAHSARRSACRMWSML